MPDQALLKSEFIRRTAYKFSFLAEDPNGTITVDGITYAETPQEPLVLGVLFRCADYRALPAATVLARRRGRKQSTGKPGSEKQRLRSGG